MQRLLDALMFHVMDGGKNSRHQLRGWRQDDATDMDDEVVDYLPGSLKGADFYLAPFFLEVGVGGHLSTNVEQLQIRNANNVRGQGAFVAVGQGVGHPVLVAQPKLYCEVEAEQHGNPLMLWDRRVADLGGT